MTKKNLLIAPLAMVALFTSCKGGNAKITYGAFVICNEVTLSKDTVEVGKDFTAKIAIKPEVLETGGFALPAMLDRVESGNRELLEGEYTYTLKEDETKADITIPAKFIEGATNIYLSVYECKVSEDEFNNAISFTGVSYAQTEIKRTFENPTTKEKIEDSHTQDFSPTVYHSIDKSEGHKLTNDPTYVEKYVATKEKDVKEIVRNSPTDSWDNHEWRPIKDKLPTPTSTIGAEIKMALDGLGGLKFGDFVYKNNVYTVDKLPSDFGTGTLILTFDKKLLIDFNFIIDPIESKEPVPTGEEITCDYEEFEIDLPRPITAI